MLQSVDLADSKASDDWLPSRLHITSLFSKPICLGGWFLHKACVKPTRNTGDNLAVIPRKPSRRSRGYGCPPLVVRGIGEEVNGGFVEQECRALAAVLLRQDNLVKETDRRLFSFL